MEKKRAEIIKRDLLTLALVLFTVLITYLVFAAIGDDIKVMSPTTGSNYSSDFLLNCTYNNISEITNITSMNTTFYHNSSGSWESILNASPYNISGNSSIATSADITNITDGRGVAFNCSIGNDSIVISNVSNITHTIIIDDTPPNVTDFYTTLGGYNFSSGNPLLNASVNDTTIGMVYGSVWFNITNWTGLQVNFSRSFNSSTDYYNTTDIINFTSLPEGMYNITVFANDTQLNNLNNSQYIRIAIDRTPPNVSSITTPAAGANLSGSVVLNATVNGTYAGVESVWFNISNSTTGVQLNFSRATKYGDYYNYTFNTLGFTDGFHNMTVFANDTAVSVNASGIITQTSAVVNLNNSKYVQVIMDNTPPAIVLTASSTTSSSLTISLTITEPISGIGSSCSVNRAGASVSGSGTSQSFAESALNCGTTYTYTVTCTDRAGNGASESGDFATSSCGSVAGGTTGGAAARATTYSVTETQLEEGYTKQLKSYDKVKVTIEDEEHTVEVGEITSSTASITISSTPQTATLAIEDTRRFDVTDDGFYDLQVTLNSIASSKADITVKSIHEEITPETVEDEEEKEEAAEEIKTGEIEEEKQQNIWIIVVVVIIIIAVVAWYIIKKKRQQVAPKK